jgi:hypothetical protein
MRWFKHMSNSRQDEKLASLMDELGLEGYGFWWCLLEIIAQGVDEKSKTAAVFSARRWGSMLGISAKKFQTYAGFCARLGLCRWENFEKRVVIDIPNILKFRDEWTERKAKKAGFAPPQPAPAQKTNRKEDVKAGAKKAPATGESPKNSKKKQTPAPDPENRYGEYQQVRLSLREYERLREKYGEKPLNEAIAYLDLHLCAKGKDPYASHAAALQKWVFDALAEKQEKQAKKNGRCEPKNYPPQVEKL